MKMGRKVGIYIPMGTYTTFHISSSKRLIDYLLPTTSLACLTSGVGGLAMNEEWHGGQSSNFLTTMLASG